MYRGSALMTAEDDMKNFLSTHGPLGAVSLVIFSASFAGAQPMGQIMPRYDKSTETTITGTIEDVMQMTGTNPQGMSGTHLTVKTDAGTVLVFLGPSMYLEQQHFVLAKGDKLEVIGSRNKLPGGEGIMARQVKKGDRVLTLRNADGMPLWMQGRPGAPRQPGG